MVYYLCVYDTWPRQPSNRKTKGECLLSSLVRCFGPSVSLFLSSWGDFVNSLTSKDTKFWGFLNKWKFCTDLQSCRFNTTIQNPSSGVFTIVLEVISFFSPGAEKNNISFWIITFNNWRSNMLSRVSFSGSKSNSCSQYIRLNSKVSHFTYSNASLTEFSQILTYSEWIMNVVKVMEGSCQAKPARQFNFSSVFFYFIQKL